MGKQIRDEEENLAFVLAIPGHPKTKHYLQDYQNALLEELIFENEIIHYLNHQSFVAVKQQAQLLKLIQERAEEKYRLHQLTMMSGARPVMPMHEQRLQLQRNIAILQEKQAQFAVAIQEEQKKIAAIDENWKKRQVQFQDNLIQQLKARQIALQDLKGNVITADELAARLKAAEATPSLSKVFTQADLRQYLLPLAMPNGKLDSLAPQQMALRSQMHNEIKTHHCTNGEMMLKPSHIKQLRQINSKLSELYRELAKADLTQNANDIGNIMLSLHRIEDLHDLKQKSELEIQEMQIVLNRLNNFVSEEKSKAPTNKSKSTR